MWNGRQVVWENGKRERKTQKVESKRKTKTNNGGSARIAGVVGVKEKGMGAQEPTAIEGVSSAQKSLKESGLLKRERMVGVNPQKVYRERKGGA